MPDIEARRALPPMTKTKAPGFSLIEAAIVLGIVGLVIGGIWVAASSVMETRRQSRALEQAAIVVDNIRKLYGRTPPTSHVSLGGLGSNQGLWNNIFPPDMIAGNVTVSPWGQMFGALVRLEGEIEIQFYLPDEFPGAVRVCNALGPRLAMLFRKERNLRVETEEGGYDVSTPALASTSCQAEMDNENQASVLVTMEY